MHPGGRRRRQEDVSAVPGVIAPGTQTKRRPAEHRRLSAAQVGQDGEDPPVVVVGGLQNWLAQQHYTQWTTYEPASRFWHFQLIGGGWLLALSVVLLAAAVWLVRRRAA